MAQLVFGMNVDELAKDIAPKSLRTMHMRYGATEGRSCGECCHFYKRRYSKVYFKCELYSDSKSEASDWRKKWQACGKFAEAPAPVVDEG
jgi:hypothetical protein